MSEFEHLAWGISQARRAWVTPADVLNTRSRADLMAWLAGPKPRTKPPVSAPATTGAAGDGTSQAGT